ncbi:hypothetical protein IR010_05025 [Flavobacterium sp. MR2016-29]|uniref:hypothetical protein n=1 Tax=Flavobacterium sp. MR2016-29 TaxID=2783795 RepID=UPI00188BC706|nr:hypothetical protein [Flavobacterium sp. MR2016-29]MBF4491896.1 hypothetical protein [Flavobacterium sp. MR2016-29]
MKTAIIILLSLFSTFIKAQEKPKDTLFFTYDDKYIKTYVEIPNHFYIKDGGGSNNGNFYFTEIKTLENPSVKSKEICLKKFIRSSKFYNKNKNPKLNDYTLWKYLTDFTIVLVKDVNGKKRYVQVESSYIIE